MKLKVKAMLKLIDAIKLKAVKHEKMILLVLAEFVILGQAITTEFGKLVFLKNLVQSASSILAMFILVIVTVDIVFPYICNTSEKSE